MDYLLDTNILVIYGRDSDLAKRIEEKYNLFDSKNSLAISVVSLGEIDAFIKKIGIGEKRQKKIETLTSRLAKVKVNSKEIISKYGDIDA